MPDKALHSALGQYVLAKFEFVDGLPVVVVQPNADEACNRAKTIATKEVMADLAGDDMEPSDNDVMVSRRRVGLLYLVS